MRLLLDTHVFIWAVTDSRKLKAAARQQMLAADQIYVSAASIWEIAIKVRLGKIEGDPERLAPDPVVADGIDQVSRPYEHQQLAHVDLRDQDPSIAAQDLFRVCREWVEMSQVRVRH